MSFYKKKKLASRFEFDNGMNQTVGSIQNLDIKNQIGTFSFNFGLKPYLKFLIKDFGPLLSKLKSKPSHKKKIKKMKNHNWFRIGFQLNEVQN